MLTLNYIRLINYCVDTDQKLSSVGLSGLLRGIHQYFQVIAGAGGAMLGEG